MEIYTTVYCHFSADLLWWRRHDSFPPRFPPFNKMDRKTFLLKLIGAGAALPCCGSAAFAESGKCEDTRCKSDAAAVRECLSALIRREENNFSRADLVKLMEERGRACCRALDFRQKLIQDSGGDVNRLVELMGKIVGPRNCTREGQVVTLIYPVTQCVCGWSPKRTGVPGDPYCECSKANNQLLFETVYGKPVQVEVADSPRRHVGAPCRFVIHLS